MAFPNQKYCSSSLVGSEPECYDAEQGGLNTFSALTITIASLSAKCRSQAEFHKTTSHFLSAADQKFEKLLDKKGKGGEHIMLFSISITKIFPVFCDSQKMTL